MFSHLAEYGRDNFQHIFSPEIELRVQSLFSSACVGRSELLG